MASCKHFESCLDDLFFLALIGQTFSHVLLSAADACGKFPIWVLNRNHTKPLNRLLPAATVPIQTIDRLISHFTTVKNVTGANCFIQNRRSNSKILNGSVAPPSSEASLSAPQKCFSSQNQLLGSSQLAVLEPFSCRFQPSLATSPQQTQTYLTEISRCPRYRPAFFGDNHQRRSQRSTKSTLRPRDPLNLGPRFSS